MFGSEQPEVLVVGAGPVGMLTALRLAERGVRVKIIDEAWGTGTRSYSCALHPETLKLLASAGPVEELLAQGLRVERLAFYEGGSRQAEINLSGLPGDYPYVLVLPQSALEGLLEQHLARHGVKVHWNHRLSNLADEGAGLRTTIDRLEGTVTGYSVPTWDWVVKKQYEARPRFLVGADGHESLVRRTLGLEWEEAGTPAVHAFYEVELEQEVAPEVRVVLDDATASALWPLSARRCRWSFQLPPAEAAGESPGKERHLWRFCDETVDRRILEQLHRRLRERAPWFSAAIKEVNWSIAVPFASRLAASFGRCRCWLAGDAIHQTSPMGMQSMNAGLREAADLADALAQVLHEGASMELLDQYNHRHRAEWRWLLGLSGEVTVSGEAGPWVAQHRESLRSCIPASGSSLASLLAQVGLESAGPQPMACAPAVG